MGGMIPVTIRLPEKRCHALGGVKPKGIAILGRGDDARELEIPLAVARVLKKLQEKNELDPPSTAAFMEALERISLECAWKRLVGLIGSRDYSSKEADDKLRLDGYGSGIRQAALARAQSCHLVDDRRYGEFFVRGKINSGWGRERIQRELELKGIQAATIPGWPDEYFSDESDYDRAYAIAARRRLSGKNDFQKLMRFLASKGFQSSIARRVSRELCEASQNNI